MDVKKAELAVCAARPDQFPKDGLPEIALSGRSNVGKSSLINQLINRKNLARTSSQPGKTRTMNFYRIDSAFYFVDLPGYGYAKVSQAMRREWGKTIERYLRERKPLRLVLLLIDFRHPPTADDRAMYEWLAYYDIPVCIVATKADKVAKGKWQKHLRQVADALGAKEAPIVVFSAENGLGKAELWHTILERLKAAR
jgi:GTP-binding protein